MADSLSELFVVPWVNASFKAVPISSVLGVPELLDPPVNDLSDVGSFICADAALKKADDNKANANAGKRSALIIV